MWLDADCGRQHLYRTEHEEGLASAIAKAPSLLFFIEGRPAYCGSSPLPKSYHALDGQVNAKHICGRFAGTNQSRVIRGRPGTRLRANARTITSRCSYRAEPDRADDKTGWSCIDNEPHEHSITGWQNSGLHWYGLAWSDAQRDSFYQNRRLWRFRRQVTA